MLVCHKSKNQFSNRHGLNESPSPLIYFTLFVVCEGSSISGLICSFNWYSQLILYWKSIAVWRLPTACIFISVLSHAWPHQSSQSPVIKSTLRRVMLWPCQLAQDAFAIRMICDMRGSSGNSLRQPAFDLHVGCLFCNALSTFRRFFFCGNIC